MANKGVIEKALTRLQAAIRQPESETDVSHGRTGRVPEDLATEEVKALSINVRDEALRQDVMALLLADARFEHLDERGVDQATWRFVCLAYIRRATDHVPEFVAEYTQKPETHRLYIPVESLDVSELHTLGEARLFPRDDSEVVEARLGIPLEPPIGSVIAVPVTGTHSGRMIDRGRAAASQALRVLRVGLREHREIVDRQLRFRLSHLFSFGEGRAGFRAQPDAAWSLPVNAEDVALVEGQSLAVLYRAPSNKLERQAQLALRWIERGLVAADETDRLLYLFMGLEALLGDRQEGLKGPALAFRRAMLSVVTRSSSRIRAGSLVSTTRCGQWRYTGRSSRWRFRPES